MNCEMINQEIDVYVDDELSPADARALEAHVAACGACRKLLDATRDLQRRAFALPSRREPAHDLWPQIAARIDTPSRELVNTDWLRAVAAAVAVVAVFAAGMLVDRVLLQDPSGIQPLQVDNEGEANHLPSVEEARRVLPVSHVELIEGSGSGAQAATEQDLLRNLLVVNLAIRRVEEGVEQDPANANLRELLADLYSQENRILVEAERLRVEQPSPTRTGI